MSANETLKQGKDTASTTKWGRTMSTTPTAPSKRSDPGGFTLMEMLIVIAIIAVLVAIAIPTFNTQLERAREAHDVYVMRQAMTLAVTSYCGGIEDESSARAAGLKWWSNGGGEQDNAAGVYDPTTGKFSPIRSTAAKAYGKGTKLTTGSEYSFNGERTAYASDMDYTNAVVMVSIYPKGNNKHIDIYWKDCKTGKYIGGNGAHNNDPKYSIRFDLD